MTHAQNPRDTCAEPVRTTGPVCRSTIALIVGSIIGVGIFNLPASLAEYGRSASGAWR